MPDLTIHDVPQEDLEAVADRARRHGRSTEQEVLQLIHDAASEQRLISQLEKATKAVDDRLRTAGTDSTATRRRYRRVDPTPGRVRP